MHLSLPEQLTLLLIRRKCQTHRWHKLAPSHPANWRWKRLPCCWQLLSRIPNQQMSKPSSWGGLTGGFEGGGRCEEGLFHSLRVIALYSHRICCSGSKHEQHLPEIHYKCVSGQRGKTNLYFSFNNHWKLLLIVTWKKMYKEIIMFIIMI